MAEQIKKYAHKTKQLIMRYKVKIIKLIPVLLLLVLAVFNSGFFHGMKSYTTNFEATDFSNSITKGKNIELIFTTKRSGNSSMDLRFVPNTEMSKESVVSMTLKDSAGKVIHEETFQDGSLFLSSYLSIDLQRLLKAGEEYTIVLASDALSDDSAYRIAMGSADTNGITQWTWNGYQENEVPDVHISQDVLKVTNTVLFMGIMLLAVAAIAVPDIQSKKKKMVYQLILLFAMPLAVFFVTEWLNKNSVLNMTPKVIAFNYLLLLLVYIVIYAISNRFSVTIIGVTSLLLAFSVVNRFVLDFRGTIIVPTDLYGISTALNVANRYRAVFAIEFLLAIALWVTAILLALRDRIVIRKGRLRVASGVLAAVFCMFTWGVLSSSTQYGNWDVFRDEFQQTKKSSDNGLYATFGINLPDLVRKQPKGYNAKNLKNFVPEGASISSEGVQPTIIVVMNESLVDMAKYGNFQTNEDPLAFIHSLAENDKAYVGESVVSTFGGGTSCSEFEFLTSVPLGFTGNSSAPLAQFVFSPTPSFASQLAQLGYTSSFMHPESPENWSRGRSYPYLGFDNLYFTHQTGITDLLRGFPTDKACYDFVLEQLEESGYAKQFFYALTIQNHGGYDDTSYSSPIEIISPEGEYPEAEQYLGLAQESDKALEYLVGELEKRDEPILLMMYGDHWPSIGQEPEPSLLAPGLNTPSHLAFMDNHTTPLVMWSNYGVDFSDVPEKLSLNYLAPVLKQILGMPLTPFDSFLLELIQQYPVISRKGIVTADGELLSADGMNAEHERLQEYVYLCYNAIFDVRNRQDWIFSYT